jgi:hypothetical protein
MGEAGEAPASRFPPAANGAANRNTDRLANKVITKTLKRSRFITASYGARRLFKPEF